MFKTRGDGTHGAVHPWFGRVVGLPLDSLNWQMYELQANHRKNMWLTRNILIATQRCLHARPVREDYRILRAWGECALEDRERATVCGLANRRAHADAGRVDQAVRSFEAMKGRRGGGGEIGMAEVNAEVVRFGLRTRL